MQTEHTDSSISSVQQGGHDPLHLCMRWKQRQDGAFWRRVPRPVGCADSAFDRRHWLAPLHGHWWGSGPASNRCDRRPELREELRVGGAVWSGTAQRQRWEDTFIHLAAIFILSDFTIICVPWVSTPWSWGWSCSASWAKGDLKPYPCRILIWWLCVWVFIQYISHL